MRCAARDIPLLDFLPSETGEKHLCLFYMSTFTSDVFMRLLDYWISLDLCSLHSLIQRRMYQIRCRIYFTKISGGLGRFTMEYLILITHLRAEQEGVLLKQSRSKFEAIGVGNDMFIAFRQIRIYIIVECHVCFRSNWYDSIA